MLTSHETAVEFHDTASKVSTSLKCVHPWSSVSGLSTTLVPGNISLGSTTCKKIWQHESTILVYRPYLVILKPIHLIQAGQNINNYLKECAEEVCRADCHERLVLELLLCAPRDVALQVELLVVLVLAVLLIDLPQELEGAVRVDLARRTVEDGVVGLV